MPDLMIRIKKKTDGNAALSCVRADGTMTWQRQDGSLGASFRCTISRTTPSRPCSDFAARSTDSSPRDGISRRSASRARRIAFPRRRMLAELIVGFFDLERATGVVGSRGRLQLEDSVVLGEQRTSADGVSHRPTTRSRRIRALRDELFASGAQLPPGETMTLVFPGRRADHRRHERTNRGQRRRSALPSPRRRDSRCFSRIRADRSGRGATPAPGRFPRVSSTTAKICSTRRAASCAKRRDSRPGPFISLGSIRQKVRKDGPRVGVGRRRGRRRPSRATTRASSGRAARASGSTFPEVDRCEWFSCATREQDQSGAGGAARPPSTGALMATMKRVRIRATRSCAA